MAKTVAYFYDPDVGNFHYGACAAAVMAKSGDARAFCRGCDRAKAIWFFFPRLRKGPDFSQQPRATVSPLDQKGVGFVLVLAFVFLRQRWKTTNKNPSTFFLDLKDRSSVRV